MSNKPAAKRPREQARRPPRRPAGEDPWDQQPWEGENAYRAFFQHYLMQENKPRVVQRAYIAYLHEQGKQERRDRSGRVAIPNSFRAWVYGTNKYGERPPGSDYEGALSWQERAAAYDKALYAEMEEEWKARQQKVREEEWAVGDKLLTRARDMLERFDASDTDWTDDTIARHLDTAIKLKRRAAGMPDRVENVGQWRVELKRLGMNPDEFVEYFAALIAGVPQDNADAGADRKAV